MSYSASVPDIIQTTEFRDWFEELRDRRARERILVRLARLQAGNPGDVKPVGRGVSELRIDYGPGYRLYYMRHGTKVIVLLCGGDERSQVKDIERALEMARHWRD